MRINEIQTKSPEGTWCHCNAVQEGLAPEELVQLAKPSLVVNLRDYNGLKEATYKELAMLIDPNFLRQGIRAAELKGPELMGFDEDTMQFLVPSSENDKNAIKYLCSIKFDDWDAIGGDSELKNAKEKALMLLWTSNIRLNCTDPSFLYWGYQYLLSVLDASINPETRKPVIRNPRERGIVCKHLNRVLRVLPFYNGQIASEFKRQFG